jgi:hypothetical protein
MALIIEVLNPRTGAVTSRRRVAAMPFTIGRALDNALVLEDPHVDARHAVLMTDDATGDVVAVDQGSVNGIQTIDQQRAERVRVRSGAEIRVGRTTLRFRDEADPIAPAIPLHGAALPVGPHVSVLPGLAFFVAVFVLVGWLEWLDTTNRAGTIDALQTGLGLAVATSIWAGIWALVARAVIHQGRFLTHLAIASGLTLLTMVLGAADEWVAFLWPDARAWSFLSTTASLVLLSASVAFHLANASLLSSARRWRAGAFVSVMFVALFGLFALADDDAFTDVPTFSARIETLRPSLVPKLDPAGLREVHAALRADVDKFVEEPD